MEKWRDAITDPPDNDEEVIVYDLQRGVSQASYFGTNRDPGWRWYQIGGSYHAGVTHWMPKPEPPQDNQYSMWIAKFREYEDTQITITYSTPVGWQCLVCGHTIALADRRTSICPQCERRMTNGQDGA